jgi:hypothetical protein
MLISILNTKKMKSKFLIMSLTEKCYAVDLQVLLSISLIPKCLALTLNHFYNDLRTSR